jgi:hypothetical protein
MKERINMSTEQHIAQLEEMLEIYSAKRLTCAHGLIIALMRELEEIKEQTS